MIYQDILAGGRAYGKPHVVWSVTWECWVARYRGCFCIDDDPYQAAKGVEKFYNQNFPGMGRKA